MKPQCNNSFTFAGSPTDYHGLQNQGSTCYLNCVLQVLFMTKDFREAVESYEHCSETPSTVETMDHQLQDLFNELKTRVARTRKITSTLGIDNVFEQRDAAEYLEKILRSLTSQEASKIFCAQLRHRNTCCECQTHIDEDGPCWSLPLALTDDYSKVYSVVDGVKAFFSTSTVNGDDQMYCDRCDAKTDATIKCEIKYHPEVLVLLLKRFEFDYYGMNYVKNSPVNVPRTLQIPESQTYELYAVVDHLGNLRSGHYTATIKSQDDDRWYEFNDTWVTQLNPQPFQEPTTKSCSAYLLMYRKKETEKLQCGTEETENEEMESVTQGQNTTDSHVTFMPCDQDRGVEVSDVIQNIPHIEQEGTQETADICTRPDNIKDVSVEKQGEENQMVMAASGDKQGKMGGDEYVQNRKMWIKPSEAQGEEGYSLEKAGTSGLPEHQGVGYQRQTRPQDYHNCTRQEDIQRNKTPHDVNEDMKGISRSKQARMHCQVYIIEEEERDGIQRTRTIVKTFQLDYDTKQKKYSMTKKQEVNDEENVIKGEYEPKADKQYVKNQTTKLTELSGQKMKEFYASVEGGAKYEGGTAQIKRIRRERKRRQDETAILVTKKGKEAAEQK